MYVKLSEGFPIIDIRDFMPKDQSREMLCVKYKICRCVIINFVTADSFDCLLIKIPQIFFKVLVIIILFTFDFIP